MRFVVAAALSTLSLVTAVSFSNVAPYLDVNGEIVQAKDGNIVFDHSTGLWAKMGMSYGLCKEPAGDSGCAGSKFGSSCGFKLNHNISIYQSPDLSSGSLKLVAKNILPVETRPLGIYFAPKIRFHPVNKVWVLWVNYLFEPQTYRFAKSQYLTATSPSITGPYTIRNTNVSQLNFPSGDFDIFVDDDNSAYLIYTSHFSGSVTHEISVERLSSDWTNSTQVSSGFFGAANVEAPVMFKRGSFYYSLFGHTCCFCGGGTGTVVHTATHPLGPWTTGAQIGAYSNGSSIPIAQQRSTFLYPPTGGPNATIIWNGNRWQSAPDGIKDHDFSTWLPLEWDDTVSPPTPKTMVWQDAFVL